MKRERPMIKCGQRRCDGCPNRDESTHKGGKTPSGNDVWEIASKTKPTPRVAKCCDDQNRRSRERERPWLQMDMGFGHG